LPRIDAFFEIHAMDTTLREQTYHDSGFIEWCRKHPRIYMQEKRSAFPGAVVYPKDDMFERFGPYFFTSSVAYMFALAISMKPEAIGLWGIDMGAAGEYGYQRAGCHFFIWEAKKAGINLVVPPESDILEPAPPYGYREASRMWWRMNTRWNELNSQRTAIANQLTQLQERKLLLEGAMDDAQYVCNTFHY
jgi:hypothetical protein